MYFLNETMVSKAINILNDLDWRFAEEISQLALHNLYFFHSTMDSNMTISDPDSVDNESFICQFMWYTLLGSIANW
jgi:hypothetical protein